MNSTHYKQITLAPLAQSILFFQLKLKIGNGSKGSFKHSVFEILKDHIFIA